MKSTENYIIKCDTPIFFYPNRHKLTVGLNDVHLEPLQTHLLLYFILHRSQLVNTQQIASEVWQRSHVSDNVVRQVISALRNHLQDKLRPYKVIQTIPKRGYLFEVDVEAFNEDEGGDASVVQRCTLATAPQAPVNAVDKRKGVVKAYRYISIVIFILFVLGCFFINDGYFKGRTEDSIAKGNKIISVYINDIFPEKNKDSAVARNVYNYLYYSINSDKSLVGYHLAHLTSANRGEGAGEGYELTGWMKSEGDNYSLKLLLKNKTTSQSIVIQKTFDQDEFLHSMGDVVVDIDAILSPGRSDFEMANSRLTSVDNYNDWSIISKGIPIFYRGEGGKAFDDITSQLQRIKMQGRENYLVDSLLSYSASLQYLNAGDENSRRLSLQLARRGFEMSPRCEISNLSLGLALILNQRFDEAYPYLSYATENATSPLGFFLLSVADMHSGDPQKAEQNYQRFLQTQKETTGQLFQLISHPQKSMLKK